MKINSEMTTRQREVYDLLAAGRKSGSLPSYREICAKLGISQNAVAQHMRALERKGLIERSGGRGRAAIVKPKPGGIPLAGRVLPCGKVVFG